MDRVIKELALKFIERAETLNYKGVKRDNAALDFFCGAAAAIEAAGDPGRARQIGHAAILMISVRGYMAVKEIAAAEVREAA